MFKSSQLSFIFRMFHQVKFDKKMLHNKKNYHCLLLFLVNKLSTKVKIINLLEDTIGFHKNNMSVRKSIYVKIVELIELLKDNGTNPNRNP